MTNTSTQPTTLTRNALYELIWTEPMTKVAPRLGLSDVGLAKVCKRYDIPRPPVGYWAKKEFGKQPPRTPLPVAADEGDEPLAFEPCEEKEAKPVSVCDRVSDPKLKELIAFESLPSNRIVVQESGARLHPLLRNAKLPTKERSWQRQGLYSPEYPSGSPHLDIEVARSSIPRAIRIMSTLINALESRGHKVEADKSEHRSRVRFRVLGEEFQFRIREKTKMVRIPESEQKRDLFSNRVRYEPTGCLVLQLQRAQTGFDAATWNDSKRGTLEEQLNSVMIETIVQVERERNWRRQREDDERRRHAEAAERWRQEQDRKKEEQKVNELMAMVGNWENADRIRHFMADLRARIVETKGPIEAGSDMDRWINWALGHADRIDPLGARRQDEPRPQETRNWHPPNLPR